MSMNQYMFSSPYNNKEISYVFIIIQANASYTPEDQMSAIVASMAPRRDFFLDDFLAVVRLKAVKIGRTFLRAYSKYRTNP